MNFFHFKSSHNFADGRSGIDIDKPYVVAKRSSELKFLYAFLDLINIFRLN
jgi:hypothetical protein